MTQASIYVHDQNGNPIQGAGIRIVDYIDIENGETDANGYFISSDLPFPTSFLNSDFYQIYADHYLSTGRVETSWYGDTGVIDMLLNIAGATHYDITVIAYQGGTTNPPPGNYSGDGVITVTATPYAGYVFDHWNINGQFLTSNPSFHTGSTGTFEAFFSGSGGGPDGNIIAVRVHDVIRALWFSWDNGAWDANGQPSVTPGANNLYIAFYAVNNGSVAGTLTLQLRDGSGNVLAQTSQSAAPGAGAQLEWTGNMPSSNFSATCTVSP